jgi:chromodomain-helicase-DNA-binding protein 4
MIVPDGATDGNAGDQPRIEVKKRAGLETYQITEFICGSCMKGGICMGCMEAALEPETSLEHKKDTSTSADPTPDGDLEMIDGTQGESKVTEGTTDGITPGLELLFRCFTCKRLSHYEHLPVPAEYKDKKIINSVALAEYYQATTEWLCGDCSSYTYALDKILAWRPYPPTAVEPPRPDDEPPHYKLPLPREYLVKWLDRSYRRTQWVPHMWLVTTQCGQVEEFSQRWRKG